VNTYTDDPNHWSNQYPWQRRGTKVRDALEQFLDLAGGQIEGRGKLPPPGNVTAADARAMLAWLREMVTKKARRFILNPPLALRTRTNGQ
jgi:hypothetical protein